MSTRLQAVRDATAAPQLLLLDVVQLQVSMGMSVLRWRCMIASAVHLQCLVSVCRSQQDEGIASLAYCLVDMEVLLQGSLAMLNSMLISCITRYGRKRQASMPAPPRCSCCHRLQSQTASMQRTPQVRIVPNFGDRC